MTEKEKDFCETMFQIKGKKYKGSIYQTIIENYDIFNETESTDELKICTRYLNENDYWQLLKEEYNKMNLLNE